ncbi:carboxymuconolactone decarboxylase family protein [Ramlibacter henchirensis]|uniref:Carboxymuconolactone decarboxylase family protein n=1 Tax=Ramlibacter henchirensis TaxID=204072 RepID=A0A4Z0C704_9BURK|nr:carboxymuconolactone decarboxylase family protein [Ramlibacter henchirensis]TFZ06672.1 carboxymuconolactone decarboxylase family protein [Ramlibacter henchirensis]
MPSTPRIAPAAQPLSAELAAAMERLLPPGTTPPQLFLTVARNEGLFRFLVDSGLLGPAGLLDGRRLPRALREAVILRTCVATGNDYEFNLHVQTISERMGLNWVQIEDVRREQPEPALWSREQRAAMELVDALVPRLQVSDATFAACREHLDEVTMIEITQLAGMYVAVAMQVALARPALDHYRYPEPVLVRA